MPIDTPPDWYEARNPDYALARTLAEGERALKGEGKTYLPMPDAMEAAGDAGTVAYAKYVQRADYFDGYGRAVDGLFGMLFRRPVTVMPQGAEDRPILAEVTGSGRTIDQLARLHCREVLTMGRHGLLIDAPPGPTSGRITTIAENRAANQRPFISMYRAEDFWPEFSEVRNRRVLTRVRLREQVRVPDPRDEWSTITVEQWRVLELAPSSEGAQLGEVGGVYQQRLYTQEVDDQGNPTGEFVETEVSTPAPRGGAALDRIPFYFTDVDGEPETDAAPPPPLLPLMQKNVSLYRTLADLEHGAWFCGLPQPWITGTPETDAAFVVGSPVAWVIPQADARVGVLTHNGDGLTILEKRAEEKRREMALLGARILEPSQRQVEAYGTALVHRQGEISVLQAIALLCSETLTAALRELVEWSGEPIGEVDVEVNTDFIPREAEPALVGQMLQALIAGKIPGEEWWEFLRHRQVFRTEKTWGEALAEIKDERDEDESGLGEFDLGEPDEGDEEEAA